MTSTGTGSDTPDPHVEFEIRVPAELEGGVYANILTLWSTAYEFTLDFAATLPPVRGPEGPGGIPQINVPCRVVARVKVPVTALFPMLQMMNDNMTQYEKAYGAIKQPGDEEPLYPPEEQIGQWLRDNADDTTDRIGDDEGDDSPETDDE